MLVHADFDCLSDENECIRFAYLSMEKHSVAWEYLTLNNYYYCLYEPGRHLFHLIDLDVETLI